MSEKDKLKKENPLYKYLKKNKINLAKFSKDCNLSRCHLHKILRGSCVPRASTVEYIVKATKGAVSVDDIREYEAKFTLHRLHSNPLVRSWRLREEELR